MGVQEAKKMANQWFKFYGGEYLSDPKIDRLSAQERSCWVTLLCLGSMNGGGKINFLTIEVLLNKSGINFDPYKPEEWEAALGVLKKFENLKMITLDDDGSITIKNWEKRQEMALTNAERQARYRKKKNKSNENVTGRVTKVTLEENRIEENRIEKKKNNNTNEAEASYTLPYSQKTRAASPAVPTAPSIRIEKLGRGDGMISDDVVPPKFDYASYLLMLKNSSRKFEKVMALIWKRKGYTFANLKQAKAQYGKDVKWCKELEGYSGPEIDSAISHCEKDSKEKGYVWSASTVSKKIANIVNV